MDWFGPWQEDQEAGVLGPPAAKNRLTFAEFNPIL
jgi:hypothetical protein